MLGNQNTIQLYCKNNENREEHLSTVDTEDKQKSSLNSIQKFKENKTKHKRDSKG
jgi:hypothetical protein